MLKQAVISVVLSVAVIAPLAGQSPATPARNAPSAVPAHLPFSEGRARTNYALNCQGCHFADASGLGDQVPRMAGEVARFLHVDGGRDYLIRVPGMSNAAVSDEALAELANWTLYTFDREHIPADFAPYTAEEVAKLRKQTFTTGAVAERERLLEKLAVTAAQE